MKIYDINEIPEHLKEYFEPVSEMGNESTLQEFVDNLMKVITECKRVLTDYGSFWLNMGDTYAGSGTLTPEQCPDNAIEKKKVDAGVLPAKKVHNKVEGVKRKSMCMVPERVALAMVDDGWVLRNKIIWLKPSVVPQSAKDRFTMDWEYIYFFTKKPKYYFEQQFEKCSSNGKEWNVQGGKKYVENGLRSGKGDRIAKPMRNCRSVWKVSSQPVKEAHFATFPFKLLERPIIAGCPELVCTGKNSPVQTIRIPVKIIDRSKLKKQDRGVPGGRLDGALKLTQEYTATLIDGCGKPVVPVIEKKILESKIHPHGDRIAENKDNNFDTMNYDDQIRIPVKEPTTTATHCSCGALFRRGIVLDPFMGCYDDKTELLTKDGWMLFKDITKDSMIATEDLDGNLIYDKPLTIYKYHYEGKMYRVKTKFVDLSVTPNHRVYGRKPHTDWRFWLPEDIKSYFRFRRNTNWIGEDTEYFDLDCIKIKMDDWLSFLGIWIADGHVNHTGRGYSVSITQKNKINEMKNIMSKLDLKWNEYEKGNGNFRFTTANQKLHKYLKVLGKAKDKYVPRFVFDLSQRQINIFLDAFCLGDGHRLKDNSRHFYTSSKRLADDLLECLFKSGTAGSLIQRKRKAKYHSSFDRVIKESEIFEVHESLVSLQPKIRSLNDKSREKQLWTEDYSGMVYCVEVQPSHLLYVRRNGRSVWCGNSGTTAIVARALDRDYIGIELNPEYIEMAHKRLKEWPKELVLRKLQGKNGKIKKIEEGQMTLDWLKD